ncbi:MAG: DUF2142 domain-containing protein [Anaerolineales bacterium]|jgi:uncharacterized membrane protein
MSTNQEKVTLKPEMVFVILAGFFGLLFLLVTPPFEVPDEYQHFDDAYAVSMGRFFGYTFVMPRSIENLQELTLPQLFHPEVKVSYADLTKFFSTPLNPSDAVPSNYLAVAKDNPIPYLPVAVGILIAKFLNLDTLDFFYFGRVVALCVWIGVVYWGIKLLPEYKWAFLLIILTPMALFEAGSYSTDMVLDSVAFLWTCVCLSYSSPREQPFSTKARSLLILLAALISVTKPPYFFLLGLYFLIPRANFGSRRQYWKTTILLFGIGFLLLLFDYSYLKSNDFTMGNASVMGQIRFLLSSSPFTFLIVTLRAVKYYGAYYYWHGFIGLLGWLDTPLPDFVYTTYSAMLLFFCLIDQQKERVFRLQQKLVSLLCVGAVVFLIFLSLYLTWTPVGHKDVEGFQGRYLIPVLPALVPLFKNRFVSVSANWKGLLVTAYLIVVLSVTVRTLILRYYVA